MSLWLRWLRDVRGHVMVCDSLPVPAHPSAAQFTPVQEVGRKGNDRALARRRIDQKTDLVFTDKAYPHAILETMAMFASPNPSSDIFSYGLQACRAFGRAVGGFVDVARDRDCVPVVGWSFDPLTSDRPSLQGVKMFHAHLMARTSQETDYIDANLKLFGSLQELRKRRIIDESSTVAGAVIHELHRNAPLRAIEPIPPGESALSAVLLQFHVKGGWTALARSAAWKDLNVVHNWIVSTYAELLGLFGPLNRTSHSEIDYRGRPINPMLAPADGTVRDRVHSLSLSETGAVQSMVRDYLGAMRPDVLGRQPMSKATETHVVPLAGPAYGITLAENGGDVVASFRVGVFSDLGSAGVAAMGDRVVKVKKGVEQMTPEQVGQRNEFQQNLVDVALSVRTPSRREL